MFASLLYVLSGGIFGCRCRPEDCVMKTNHIGHFYVQCTRCLRNSGGVKTGVKPSGEKFHYAK